MVVSPRYKHQGGIPLPEKAGQWFARGSKYGRVFYALTLRGDPTYVEFPYDADVVSQEELETLARSKTGPSGGIKERSLSGMGGLTEITSPEPGKLRFKFRWFIRATSFAEEIKEKYGIECKVR